MHTRCPYTGSTNAILVMQQQLSRKPTATASACVCVCVAASGSNNRTFKYFKQQHNLILVSLLPLFYYYDSLASMTLTFTCKCVINVPRTMQSGKACSAQYNTTNKNITTNLGARARASASLPILYSLTLKCKRIIV